MKIEHVAYMVADPVSMAKWYVEHLGMSVKRANPNPPTYGHFLADLSGMMLLELYSGPKEKVPNYNAIDPAVLHLALVSPDLKKDYSRLLSAGAREAEAPRTLPNGDTVAMLRDPWGLAVQLVQRAKPLLG